MLKQRGTDFSGKIPRSAYYGPGVHSQGWHYACSDLKWSVIEDRNFYVKSPVKQHPDTWVFSAADISGGEDILSFAEKRKSIHLDEFAAAPSVSLTWAWDPANAPAEEFSPTDNPISRAAAVFHCQVRLW